MKATDHNVDYLRRSLRDEAVWLRRRAQQLDGIATAMTKDVKAGIANPHTFEFVVQEVASLLTHRSNVFPQTIFRACTSLAAEAAVEWAENKRIAEMDAALAAEQGR